MAVDPTKLPKACVILGAGASHAIHAGSPVGDLSFRPPLAKELFDTDAHPEFWNEAMAPYPDVTRNHPYQAAWTQVTHHPRREPS